MLRVAVLAPKWRPTYPALVTLKYGSGWFGQSNLRLPFF